MNSFLPVRDFQGMKMKQPEFSKLTKAYLNKYFKNKKLPCEKWDFIVDGVSHSITNHYVIDSILKATPEHQKMIAEALHELEDAKQDVNGFLKNLALQRYSKKN